MAAFITVADAKLQLNVTTANYDTELAGFVNAACDMVEQRVGAIATRVITSEYVDLQGRTIFNELTSAGTRDFVLRWRPVQSIQAIASAILSGVTYTPSDFWIDTNTGIVRRNDGGTIFGPLRVDYTAGYVTPPDWAVLAAKIIVQSLWKTQRGSGTRRPGAGQAPDVTPAGDTGTIPPAAEILLAGHDQVPAIG